MKTRACLKYYLSDRSSLITKRALFYLARVYDLSAHPVTRLELKCNSLVLYPSSRSNLLQKLFDYSKRFNSQDELQSLENCFDTFGPLALTLFENINCVIFEASYNSLVTWASKKSIVDQSTAGKLWYQILRLKLLSNSIGIPQVR